MRLLPTLTFVAALMTALATGSPVALERRATTATAATNPQIVYSISSGAFQVQCLSSQITIFMNLNVAATMAGVAGLLPMEETGLPVIDMAFFVGGTPAQVTVPNSYNVNPSTGSGNTWSFGLLDDQPNIGGQINLGPCTQDQAIGAVTASFSSKTVIQGVGLPDRGVPALTGIPTLVNNLAAANVAAGGSTATTTTTTGTTAKATPSATPSPSTTPAPASANGSIVVTLANDPGQNGGQGINNIQCSGGKLSTTINLQASVNVNGIHAYQPMAETGLPTISMAFYVAGKAAAVTVQNSFNVADSKASGNQWVFTLQDDGPHPGAQLSLGACTQGAALPQITASFSTSSFIVGQGLPNGADGGPAVPAVNGVPTIVNGLPAQFVAAKTTAKATPTPTPSAAPSPSCTPAATGSMAGTTSTTGSMTGTTTTSTTGSMAGTTTTSTTGSMAGTTTTSTTGSMAGNAGAAAGAATGTSAASGSGPLASAALLAATLVGGAVVPLLL